MVSMMWERMPVSEKSRELPFLTFFSRRRRDSNPRAPEGKRISSAPRYDRFDTSPNEWLTEDSTVRHSISISYLVDFARCFREKS